MSAKAAANKVVLIDMVLVAAAVGMFFAVRAP